MLMWLAAALGILVGWVTSALTGYWSTLILLFALAWLLYRRAKEI